MKRLLKLVAFLLGTVVVASSAAGWLVGAPGMASVARALLLGAALLLVLWSLAAAIRALLYRVGRRLAFSYFLIGVLPIPMVGLLALLSAYLVSGSFLAHIYRDAAVAIERDLERSAAAALAAWMAGPAPEAADGSVALAYYRNGRRVAGDPRLPLSWPLDPGDRGDRADGRRPVVSYFELPDGRLTLSAASARAEREVVAVFAGDVDAELGRRSGLWVGLYRADDPALESRIRVAIGGRSFALQPFPGRERLEGRDEWLASQAGDGGWLERPLLWWGELSGPLVSLADGSVAADDVTASLNGSARSVFRHLSSSAEVDAAVWGGLLAVSTLLGTVYLAAAAMAVLIIVTLSHAVNRLTSATRAVQRGDFSARIPVRRSDQVGDLQRSFNQMTANLESLVATAAQKETLERELAIARTLQKSLLPSDLPRSEAIEFATLFEPSAAIGGDYFDIFRLGDERLAVIVADVSGHGLPTGLRMAMLKAALVILIEQAKEPREILERLSSMVRAERERRFFVTATVARVDFARGSLELTNAAHPPTYLLRAGRVEEILLPGNPLGALGSSYGEAVVGLEPGDFVVWLSDGLIEARDAGGWPFGYERVARALAGRAASAEQVRERLMAAVAGHTGGEPPEDDMTLVVMRYRGGADGPPSDAETRAGRPSVA